MKTLLFFVMLSFLSGLNFAQSDFEIKQSFLTKYKQIEVSIEYANDATECTGIAEQIEKLKNEFSSHSTMLNDALYPDDFASMFAKLNKKLSIRQTDVSQIGDLKVQVTELNDQLLKLNQENSELMSQVQTLRRSATKNAKTIDSLKYLVKRLSAKLKERDELVMGMVDSLFQQITVIPATVNDYESNGVFKKIATTNFFENIKRSVYDNMKFMRVTQLTTEDLSEIRGQQKELSSRWQKVGPSLAKVYLQNKQQANEVTQINELFDSWKQEIDSQVWNRVNDLFVKQNIHLLQFKSGEEFANSITTFVQDEIKNYGVKGKDESDKTYTLFVDSTWFKEVEPTWLPYLLNNKMISEANKDSLDSQIKMWKEKVSPSQFPLWIIYVVVGIIMVTVLSIVLFRKPIKVDNDKPEIDS
ncbi:MAG: hypothetical protein WCS69_06570 [Ignavibacteriaceae bacterium]|jgi:predicted  nucleic acid-binding Zn-ribbon protein